MDKVRIGSRYYAPNDDKHFELFKENEGESIMIITGEKITALYNEIPKQKSTKIQIGTLKIKQRIKVGDCTWSLFIKEDGKFYVMLDKEYSVNIKQFGTDNDYSTSDARKTVNNCNASKKALEIFGADILIPTRLDLLSHDGLGDYGVCEGDLFGVITYDMYRMNRKNIDISYMITCTPDSTPSGHGDSNVRVVTSDGCVCYDDCECSEAVRPFCILPSDIFVTPVNKL